MNRGEQTCGNCACFKPHDTYKYLAVCVATDKLMVKKPSTGGCAAFKEVSYEDLRKALLTRGWLYCVSCDKPLFTVEELAEHLEHELGSDLFCDVAAREEAPPAS